MSHETAEQSVMMQVPSVGPFVRCLLPVALTGGYRVTFGVWIAVHPDDLRRAFSVWWEPEYAQLALDGWLANRLPTWDCLAASVHATVEDPEHTPYIRSSDDGMLSRVLKDEWPHEPVLSALPT
jgi:hypothetical protein